MLQEESALNNLKKNIFMNRKFKTYTNFSSCLCGSRLFLSFFIVTIINALLQCLNNRGQVLAHTVQQKEHHLNTRIQGALL